MRLRLEDLKKTKSFYKVELEKEELAGGERNSYSKALKLIEGFIEKREMSGEKEKQKKFMAYDHKAILREGKKGY